MSEINQKKYYFLLLKFTVQKEKVIYVIKRIYMAQSKVLCATGGYHTVTLSDDGIVYAFGWNVDGQFGFKKDPTQMSAIPTPIPNLPVITQVNCGFRFTVCIDELGFVWSFGANVYGQLGIGNTTNAYFPQKITDISPVKHISCGLQHVLAITDDNNLWSFGDNSHGQLCIGDKIKQLKPKQTIFSNVSYVSAGGLYSLFQSNNKVYGCGYNYYGQLGLGNNTSVVQPSLVPDQPLPIVQLSSGYYHSLLLDEEGNVFSTGDNAQGQLGIDSKENKNVFTKISQIPPIARISCVSNSSFLIDLDGNVWSFGENSLGQLAIGSVLSCKVPTKVESLKDIKQISIGYSGFHFLAKDSHNKIFASGSNEYGQLGIGSTNSKPTSNPVELNSDYFDIWGYELKSRAKSARK